MQFFQQENVRKILTDVLFCYARENEQLLYKQVMKISYRWHPLTQNCLYSLTNDRAIMQPLLYPKLYHNANALQMLLVRCMVRKVSSLKHMWLLLHYKTFHQIVFYKVFKISSFGSLLINSIFKVNIVIKLQSCMYKYCSKILHLQICDMSFKNNPMSHYFLKLTSNRTSKNFMKFFDIFRWFLCDPVI